MAFNSESGFYIGKVYHSRFSPKKHSFDYNMFMVWLDLDKVSDFFKIPFFLWSRQPSVVAMERNKYLPDHEGDLKSAVAAKIKDDTGEIYKGRVFLLTHLSYFGLGFNPVSFYYCFNQDMTRLEYILAEITNTPWDERHTYVLKTSGKTDKKHSFIFDKLFHVSPFFDMDHVYHWSFSDPEFENLGIEMENKVSGELVFRAGLNLAHFQRWSNFAFLKLVARFPLMTFKVLGAIYFQALRLFLKGIPFFTHPKKRKAQG